MRRTKLERIRLGTMFVLAALFFADGIPASLNSANVVLLPAMDDIQNRADSRQALWSIFCKFGMVKTSEQQPS